MVQIADGSALGGLLEEEQLRRREQGEYEALLANRLAFEERGLNADVALEADQEIHDACGLGFAVRTKEGTGNSTRKPIKDGLKMLECQVHRGKDGAGLLMELDKKFYREKLRKEQGVELTENFGTGMFFLDGRSEAKQQEARELIEKHLRDRGVENIYWREVPTDSNAISSKARATEPKVMQAFFDKPEYLNDNAFEKAIYEANLEMGQEKREPGRDLYIHTASMSSKSIVYKILGSPTEVRGYYEDLRDENLDPNWVITHTRFSTNTEPKWELAQPRLMLVHNGEINTIDRNARRFRMRRREMSEQKIPKMAGLVDTGWLDFTTWTRVVHNGWSLSKALFSSVQAIGSDIKNKYLEAMYKWMRLDYEEHGGPKGIIACDGEELGLCLDKGGLRPMKYLQTADGYYCGGSEQDLLVGGPDGIDPAKIVKVGSLRGGEFRVVDLKTGKIKDHETVMKELAGDDTYQDKLNDRILRVSDEIDFRPPNKPEEGALTLAQRQRLYGWNAEQVDNVLLKAAATGKNPVIAMGNSRALTQFSKAKLDLYHYFNERFAQVTNPPIDPIREKESMTLKVALGKKPARDPNNNAKQVEIDSPILRPGQLTKIENAMNANAKDGEKKVAKIRNTSFEASRGKEGMESAIEAILQSVDSAVSKGAEIIVLQDKQVDKSKAVVPMAMAVAAVNEHLIRKEKRLGVSVVCETGEVSNSHQASVLLSLGAEAINPYLAYETISDQAGKSKGGKKLEVDRDTAFNNFLEAMENGIRKTMSKMGVLDVQSYIGGRLMESDSLNLKGMDLLSALFSGLHSPIGGHGVKEIAENQVEFNRRANDESMGDELPYFGLYDSNQNVAKAVKKGRAKREDLAERGYSDIVVDAMGAMLDEENNARLARFLSENEAAVERALGSDLLTDTGDKKQDVIRKAVRDLLEKSKTEGVAVVAGELSTNKDFAVKFGGARNYLANILTSVLTPEEYEVGSLEDLTSGLDQRGSSKTPDPYVDTRIFTEEEIDSFRVTDAYRKFSEIVENESARQPTKVRDFFRIKTAQAGQELSTDEVQSVSSIVSECLTTGNMSDGALETHVHRILAIGMNRIGGKSGSGEGGEAKERWGNELLGSKIKQIASGRFGAIADYLACLPEDGEIEIKVAQGAKPGEGGQLPGSKVDVEIAIKRGAIPGGDLVSPPPHHDIYSIEDLAQLIYTLKAAERNVGVKLVSSQGIGVIAVGVAKALADAGLDKDGLAGTINIAGGSGGTGAAELLSVHHAGNPSEVGLREVDQHLRNAGFRDLIKLRFSGGIKNGRDVVKAVAMGADSVEMGTSPMITEGCIKADICNTRCPRYVATQDGRWEGQVNDLERYGLNMGAEVQEILAMMGEKSLSKVRGDMSRLEEIEHEEIRGNRDFSKLKEQPENQKLPDDIMEGYQNVGRYDDEKLVPEVQPLIDSNELKDGKQHVIEAGKVENCDRSIGAKIAMKLSRYLKFGEDDEQVEKDALRINYEGTSGQAFGAFNRHGMHQHLDGATQDYVAHGMSGGVVSIKKRARTKYKANENIISGNAVLYGAAGGEAYFNGQVGDRAAIRNSGASAVFEGAGDWAGSFMTDGTILNLGELGKHACAGASGGAFIQYDPEKKYQKGKNFSENDVNLYSSSSEGQEEDTVYQKEIKRRLENHLKHTGSEFAQYVLDGWDKGEKHNFTIAVPKAMEKTLAPKETDDPWKGMRDVVDTMVGREESSYRTSPGVIAAITGAWQKLKEAAIGGRQ